MVGCLSEELQERLTSILENQSFWPGDRRIGKNNRLLFPGAEQFHFANAKSHRGS
jgi:hypothetical protein